MGSLNEQPPLEVRWVKAPELEAPEDRELVERTVRAIINAVRERGDAAVREYSARLDHWNPEQFRVSQAEIEQAPQPLGSMPLTTSPFCATRSEPLLKRSWPA